MFVRAGMIRFRRLHLAWGAAFFALALLIATPPSQACGQYGHMDAGVASQPAAADIETSAPTTVDSLWAASDHAGCCAGASHASGCANGSCAPCAAALVDVATMVDPPVITSHLLPAPDTPTRTAPSGNFRPPRAPA